MMLKPLPEFKNLIIKGYFPGDSMQIKGKPIKTIDITPGVCGNNKHCDSLTMSTTGAREINGIIYHWGGGCSLCVEEKLKGIENETTLVRDRKNNEHRKNI